MMEEKDAELRSVKVSATQSASLLDKSLRKSVSRHSQWPALRLEPSLLQMPRSVTVEVCDCHMACAGREEPWGA